MDRELEEELQRVLAEYSSIQLVLEGFMRNLSATMPDMNFHILKAFDEAVKQLSMASEGKARHLPETLRMTEQMRLILIGEGKRRPEN
jgi:hypothetical protein